MTVDWTEQWRTHAPNFSGGCAHIDLRLYGIEGSLKLLPGAGFGDTSHPTTRLVLKLMASHLRESTLIDIGCGTGILSLAALIGGAKRAIGIDIEKEAIEHARINAAFNELDHAHFADHFPDIACEKPLIVMNMISSEQRAAWNSLPILHNIVCPIITSGVLYAQRASYLEETAKRGWQLEQEIQEEEWVAFRFRKKKI